VTVALVTVFAIFKLIQKKKREAYYDW
jgi:hypothetical protein